MGRRRSDGPNVGNSPNRSADFGPNYQHVQLQHLHRKPGQNPGGTGPGPGRHPDQGQKTRRTRWDLQGNGTRTSCSGRWRASLALLPIRTSAGTQTLKQAKKKSCVRPSVHIPPACLHGTAPGRANWRLGTNRGGFAISGKITERVSRAWSRKLPLETSDFKKTKAELYLEILDLDLHRRCPLTSGVKGPVWSCFCSGWPQRRLPVRLMRPSRLLGLIRNATFGM